MEGERTDNAAETYEEATFPDEELLEAGPAGGDGTEEQEEAHKNCRTFTRRSGNMEIA